MDTRTLIAIPTFFALLASACTPAPDSDRTDAGGAPVGDAGVTADAAPDADHVPSAMPVGRPLDPVIVVGAQLPRLSETAAGDVVAFRWEEGWSPVPVQVDERVVRTTDTVYGIGTDLVGDGPEAGFETVSLLVYADPDTFVGADDDPRFDADDELVVLAGDLGPRAPAGVALPDHVREAGATELRVGERAGGGPEGWVYLFERADDALSPDAGRPPAVELEARFVGHDGEPVRAFYDPWETASGDGPRRECGGQAFGVAFPEDTWIRTAHYERHFAGRWLSDALVVRGAEREVDILDTLEVRPRVFDRSRSPRTQPLAVYGTEGDGEPLPVCGRSVTSYSGGRGVIVTQRGGPLRVIRSYIGANSGPLTQRTHLFYPDREDVLSSLRVHTVPGATDLFDLSRDAIGMTYYNEWNRDGIAIDGTPDPYNSAPSPWEVLTGPQGTLITARDARSEPQYPPMQVVFDALETEGCACSGDDESLLLIGSYIGPESPEDPIACTDPRTTRSDCLQPNPNHVSGWRATIYQAMAVPLDEAAAIADRALTGYVVESLAIGDEATRCGDGECVGAETCPVDCAGAPGSYANGFDACGNGICDWFESNIRCGDDCGATGPIAACGDGSCDAHEAPWSCPADCTGGRASYFACIRATHARCDEAMIVCLDEADCAAAVACLDACDGDQASCAASCRPAEDTLGQRQFDGLNDPTRCARGCVASF